MKKISLILAVLLFLIAVPGALAARVRATGDVNVRSGPGLDYGIIDTLYTGSSLEYTGQTRYDDRGVAWYSVNLYGKTAWISSRYSELEGKGDSKSDQPYKDDSYADSKGKGDSGSKPFYKDDFHSDSNGKADSKSDLVYKEDSYYGSVEVSGYFMEPLDSAASALGLDSFYEDDSEVPKHYSDGSLTLAGWNYVEYFELREPGYSIFGVWVGMGREAARQVLIAAGLKYNGGDSKYMSFEYPASGKSPFGPNGFDGVISVEIRKGVVRSISWSTYSDIPDYDEYNDGYKDDYNDDYKDDYKGDYNDGYKDENYGENNDEYYDDYNDEYYDDGRYEEYGSK